MTTIVKIVTSSSRHSNLVYRDRDFVGTSNIKYFYKDQYNLGPGTIYTMSNYRETHQPHDWNYRQRIRTHSNATTFLTGEKYVLEPSNSYWGAFWNANDGTIGKRRDQYDQGRGSMPSMATLPPAPVSSLDPNAALEAKMKLYKQLKDKRQAWEGMVFLGELRELLHMVRNPAQSLRRGLDEWVSDAKKHRSRSSSAAINRALAGSWLEWVYGVAPTIGDLENAKEALNRHLERYEELYQKFSAWSEPNKSLFQDWTSYSRSYYPWTFSMAYRTFYQTYVGYYGQVYTASAYSRGFTRQQLGFELRNFVPTVWELIPYSFVADYFTNIGDLLAAASTYTGDVAWVSQTVINESYVEHVYKSLTLGQLNASPSTVKNLRVIVQASDPLIIRRRKVTRGALAGIPNVNPFKDFRFEVPGYGSKKWINILALFSASRSTERLLRSGR